MFTGSTALRPVIIESRLTMTENLKKFETELKGIAAAEAQDFEQID